MLQKEMKKTEILEELEGLGDFARINYLNRYLELMPPIHMRRFAYIKLAEIYNKRGMFKDAAKMMRNVAINVSYPEKKQEYHLKESKLYILAGLYDESSQALKKAFSEGNLIQQRKLAEEIRKFYLKVAQKLEKENKLSQTSKIYEKMLKLGFTKEEKQKFKEKLLDLYTKLGKRKEYAILKGMEI